MYQSKDRFGNHIQQRQFLKICTDHIMKKAFSLMMNTFYAIANSNFTTNTYILQQSCITETTTTNNQFPHFLSKAKLKKFLAKVTHRNIKVENRYAYFSIQPEYCVVHVFKLMSR